jgi:phosphate:Na+ symporter
MDWAGAAAGTLGGVGLFLLGMRLMSDGLRIAAGRALRRILERWTATRLRAMLSGAFITSLVQSSSAVTVAVIGFANAGLLTLGQAVALIYGSNVGTTATGWLVALVGFHVSVKAAALPAIGLGMALRVGGGGRRSGALGEAIAGFGLFFLGIDVLKGALAGIESELPLSALEIGGVGAVAVFTLVGFALTVLMQSSSAAIAIILTSVGGGVVPIEAGACLVIGANVGTTSTAAISVVGATSNAKRVALAHVAFNVTTGLVALVTLPLLLLLVGRFRQTLGLASEPAAVVAAFHTLFNLLGVALMLPLTNVLVSVLARSFQTREEEEGRARFLDRNVLTTPLLAVRALGLELARVGAVAREMAHESLRRGASAAALGRRRESITSLVDATGEFVTELQRQRLSGEAGSALPVALRVARYYAEAGELAQSIAAGQEGLEPLPPDLRKRVEAFEEDVRELLARTAVDTEGTTPAAAARTLEHLLEAYQALKSTLLEAGAVGAVPVGHLVAHLDRLSNVRRMAEQMERGARYLWALAAVGEEGEAAAGLASLDTASGEARIESLPPAAPGAGA